MLQYLSFHTVASICRFYFCEFACSLKCMCDLQAYTLELLQSLSDTAEPSNPSHPGRFPPRSHKETGAPCLPLTRRRLGQGGAGCSVPRLCIPALDSGLGQATERF